jgi:DNA mismatch repair protein MutL
MAIRLLSESAINKIAAGEVVERPLAVVKELVENSIDAAATSIAIQFMRGGRTLISVSDNGAGIAKDELQLAIQRHATSKLDESALDNIEFLGFRGEAIPSIAAVSQMRIASYAQNSESAWEINLSGGQVVKIAPCVRSSGTIVEVRDLFCFTPSRLKFLKSESNENASCIDLITKFALSAPHIEFKLNINDKTVLHASLKEESRIANLLGHDFVANTVAVQHELNGIRVHGYASLPTFHHALSSKQYFYVNNRMVRDKILIGAMKGAYANLIPHGRYPIGVLFIELAHSAVDVNVHPTKAEVRFQEEQKVRYALIDAIRSSLAKSDLRHSTTTSEKALNCIEKSVKSQPPRESSFTQRRPSVDLKLSEKLYENDGFITRTSPSAISQDLQAAHKQEPIEQPQVLLSSAEPLGSAKCQVDNTYIIAETGDGVVIVDQHAAHERIVLEQMKMSVASGEVAVQYLLIPEVVELGQAITINILNHAANLRKLGLIIERNGLSQILVLALPALFGQIDIRSFLTDIAAHVSKFDNLDNLSEVVEKIYGNIACKNSIKAGRKMSIEEMNGLLRSMEQTAFSGQCNHGRPTYIKLTVKELEKIFERS